MMRLRRRLARGLANFALNHIAPAKYRQDLCALIAVGLSATTGQRLVWDDTKRRYTDAP